jgi:hypothetical protein
MFQMFTLKTLVYNLNIAATLYCASQLVTLFTTVYIVEPVCTVT